MKGWLVVECVPVSTAGGTVVDADCWIVADARTRWGAKRISARCADTTVMSREKWERERGSA